MGCSGHGHSSCLRHMGLIGQCCVSATSHVSRLTLHGGEDFAFSVIRPCLRASATGGAAACRTARPTGAETGC